MDTITFLSKTYEFASEFERDMAQDMLDKMTAAHKPNEYIEKMLSGLGKLSNQAEKFAALEIYQKITALVRENADVQSFVNAALAQFARKSNEIGVKLDAKLGNKVVADVEITDEDTIYAVMMNARQMTDEVTISFLQDDDTRYVRVAVESKDALALIEQATGKAASLVTDEITEKGFRVAIGEDWYPEIKPVSAGGGSKAGLTKTRFVKFIWNGKQYDGLKKDVAKQLVADGMPTDQKLTKDGKELTVKLSGEYYSKWLDMLDAAGLFRDYEKYNKSSD